MDGNEDGSSVDPPGYLTAAIKRVAVSENDAGGLEERSARRDTVTSASTDVMRPACHDTVTSASTDVVRSARHDTSASTDVERPARRDTVTSTSTDVEDGINYRKLFVGNIGYRQNWKDLKDFFSKFGEVVYTYIVYDHIRQRSRGQLRINYATESKKSSFTLYPSVPTLGDTEQGSHLSHTQTGEDKIQMLTIDEWKYIFEFFTVPEQVRLERVCRYWRDMALNVWKGRRELVCNGFSFYMHLTDKVLTSLLNRCGENLRVLDLGARSQMLSEYSMTIIGHYCPRLWKLNMSGVQATSVGLRDLSRQVKGLKWINLHKCHLVAEKGLWWLMKNCENLEHIEVTENTAVTGKCFFMLKPSLRCLRANWCRKLSDFGMEQLREKCPHLRELQIRSCNSLTDAGIEAVTKMSELEVLDIGGTFPNATTRPWTALRNLHKLTSLSLDFNPFITDAGLQAIADGCPNLRCLSLQGCKEHITKMGLSALPRLKQLRSLDISYIKEVDDTLLESVARHGLLEKLVVHICPEVTNTGVQRVLSLCPHLRHLDLSGNSSLTTSALAPLVKEAYDPPLKLTLTVIIGGTTMVLELEEKSEGARLVMDNLPTYVKVQQRNLSLRIFDNDSMIYLPPPVSDDEEEDLEAAALLEDDGAEEEGMLFVDVGPQPQLEDPTPVEVEEW